MRIISGSFRGKKIFEPRDKKTRPLKDLVKESIFNIINHSKKMNIEISNSNILDLYSGVGSFGIECLSRGAEKVIFVENYHKVLPILKKNLSDLRTINNYQILEFDINKNFESKKIKDKFDIIFLDPPFKDKNLEELLDNMSPDVYFENMKPSQILTLDDSKDYEILFSLRSHGWLGGLMSYLRNMNTYNNYISITRLLLDYIYFL